MTSVAEFVSSIKSLKEREDMIFAFGMLGDTNPVSVSLNGLEPDLDRSCESANGQADAAVRIAEFLGAFAHNKIATACTPDLSSTLAEFGTLTASGMRQAACASGLLADADRDRPDVQPICEVVDVSGWERQPRCGPRSSLAMMRQQPGPAMSSQKTSSSAVPKARAMCRDLAVDIATGLISLCGRTLSLTGGMMTTSPSMLAHDQYVTMGGLRFHYRVVGAPGAPPIVVLHGIMGHSRE